MGAQRGQVSCPRPHNWSIQGLAPPAGPRGDSCETQLASSSYHGSAFSPAAPSTCLPSSAPRKERTDWEITGTGHSSRLQGRPCPHPRCQQSLSVFATTPGAVRAGQALASENHPTNAHTHAAHTQCTSSLLELPGATAVQTCRGRSSP